MASKAQRLCNMLHWDQKVKTSLLSAGIPVPGDPKARMDQPLQLHPSKAHQHWESGRSKSGPWWKCQPGLFWLWSWRRHWHRWFWVFKPRVKMTWPHHFLSYILKRWLLSSSVLNQFHIPKLHQSLLLWCTRGQMVLSFSLHLLSLLPALLPKKLIHIWYQSHWPMNHSTTCSLFGLEESFLTE